MRRSQTNYRGLQGASDVKSITKSDQTSDVTERQEHKCIRSVGATLQSLLSLAFSGVSNQLSLISEE